MKFYRAELSNVEILWLKLRALSRHSFALREQRIFKYLFVYFGGYFALSRAENRRLLSGQLKLNPGLDLFVISGLVICWRNRTGSVWLKVRVHRNNYECLYHSHKETWFDVTLCANGKQKCLILSSVRIDHFPFTRKPNLLKGTRTSLTWWYIPRWQWRIANRKHIFENCPVDGAKFALPFTFWS